MKAAAPGYADCMPAREIHPVPDEERHEPRVGDEFDPDQGPPIEDEEAPAIGVVDDDRVDVPEPNEPA
jgi:hypothetical protein